MVGRRAKRKYLAGLMVVFMLLSLLPLGVSAAEYSDIEGHWAESQIVKWLEKGLAGGYPDGTFRPDTNISRAEFAALIVKAFNLEPGEGVVFDDTANHWARDAIKTANYHGMVSGYSDKSFGPNDPVTREQIAVMIVNATKVNSTEGGKEFTDSSQIAAWAREAVAKATAAGLIGGYPDGSFRPKNNATRAEAVVILERSVQLPKEPAEEEEAVITAYDTAGTYGPEFATQTINDDVTISADGVILRNTIIKGNLTITEEVGDGDITLNNVTVEGTTYIRGGGKDSIHIDGGKYNEIIIESTPGGAVRLVAINAEGIQVVLSENAAGEEIILEGTFESVNIQADNVVLSTQGETTIKEITVQENITGTTINIAEGTKVEEIILDSKTEVNNAKGTVEKTSGAKKSDSTIANPPQAAPGGGGGGGGGTTSKVSAISVEGVAVAGSTLTAKTTPTNATVTYQWLRSEAPDGEYVEVAEAINKTYTLTNEDVEKYIKVTVEGTGSYKGTANSDPFGPIEKPAISTYKLSYDDLADSYVVGTLVDVDGKNQTDINSAVETAIGELEPVKVTLATDIIGEAGYDKVRIAPVEAGKNIQFWAKDTSNNWYDINVDGWGPSDGFPLSADNYDVTTDVYILSNAVGTYELNVKLVNVDEDDDVLAEVSGTVTVREPAHSEYGFELTGADQEFVAGDLLEGSVIGGEDGVETEGLTPVGVTLKATTVNELGYANVKVLAPDVTGVEQGTLQFWAYSAADTKWFDAAVYGWGSGFAITPDYDVTTPIYVFADKAGTYTVTFNLVDLDNDNKVIATKTETITVISKEDAAKAAIKPSWKINPIERVEGDLPAGIEDSVDYKVTIETSYEDKEAAQASGRTVTTFFTIPEKVTVYYPVWEEGQLKYKSATNEEVAYGMVGHPLSEDNIDVDGVVYVAIDEEVIETEFEFTIRLKDAEWDNVVYGEEQFVLTIAVILDVKDLGTEGDNLEDPHNVYAIHDNSSLGVWTFIIVKDRLPDCLKDATAYELWIGDKCFSLEENKLKEGQFIVDIKSDDYTEEDIENGKLRGLL